LEDWSTEKELQRASPLSPKGKAVKSSRRTMKGFKTYWIKKRDRGREGIREEKLTGGCLGRKRHLADCQKGIKIQF